MLPYGERSLDAFEALERDVGVVGFEVAPLQLVARLVGVEADTIRAFSPGNGYGIHLRVEAATKRLSDVLDV